MRNIMLNKLKDVEEVWRREIVLRCVLRDDEDWREIFYLAIEDSWGGIFLGGMGTLYGFLWDFDGGTGPLSGLISWIAREMVLSILLGLFSGLVLLTLQFINRLSGLTAADLEHVPPDLMEFFLENQKMISTPIVVAFDVQIGSGMSYEGVDIPGKVNGTKLKEESSIKEILTSSLGSNLNSSILNSIRKRIPKKLMKKKGSITGSKEVAAAAALVNSNLANKIDRSAVLVDSKQKMDVEVVANLFEVSFVSQSEINVKSINNMVATGVNLVENAPVNMLNGKSDKTESISAPVNVCMENLGEYIMNSGQYIRDVIQLYENKMADVSQGNVNSPVISGSDQKVTDVPMVVESDHVLGIQSELKSSFMSVDEIVRSDFSFDQRTKSDWKTANEVNKKNCSKLGLGKEGSEGKENCANQHLNVKSVQKVGDGAMIDEPGFEADKQPVVSTGILSGAVNVDKKFPVGSEFGNLGSKGSGHSGPVFNFGNSSDVTELGGSAGVLGNNGNNHLSASEGLQSDGKISDVVMAENVENISSVKVVPEGKKVENAWNVKGVTLADKIKELVLLEY
ncbi:hypothetical protein L6452_43408 [Arctium lappa]|uniref:Uncharacterized protein n=1 Tax=Arctium lappa TaxID=4217 RepID=A0ACB8XE25_ARCLA|nr:hypothetical protein L6452_43408 [Arctium lappa]